MRLSLFSDPETGLAPKDEQQDTLTSAFDVQAHQVLSEGCSITRKHIPEDRPSWLSPRDDD